MIGAESGCRRLCILTGSADMTVKAYDLFDPTFCFSFDAHSVRSSKPSPVPFPAPSRLDDFFVFWPCSPNNNHLHLKEEVTVVSSWLSTGLFLITELNDSQVQLALIRNCCNGTLLNHIMRSLFRTSLRTRPPQNFDTATPKCLTCGGFYQA